MADEYTDSRIEQQIEPYPGLKSLDKLVGTWKVSGPDIEGQVTYEWMNGGFFLVQQVDFVHSGHNVKGIEIIGYERGFGATAPSKDIRSRWFDNEGNTFEYTYEVEGDAHHLGRRKGLARVLQGQVQRRRQHECRRMGVSRRRRVRLDHDESQGGALIAG